MNIIKKIAQLHSDFSVHAGPVEFSPITGLLNEHNARQIGNLAVAGYEAIWEKAWNSFGYDLSEKTEG